MEGEGKDGEEGKSSSSNSVSSPRSSLSDKTVLPSDVAILADLDCDEGAGNAVPDDLDNVTDCPDDEDDADDAKSEAPTLIGHDVAHALLEEALVASLKKRPMESLDEPSKKFLKPKPKWSALKFAEPQPAPMASMPSRPTDVHGTSITSPSSSSRPSLPSRPSSRPSVRPSVAPEPEPAAGPRPGAKLIPTNPFEQQIRRQRDKKNARDANRKKRREAERLAKAGGAR